MLNDGSDKLRASREVVPCSAQCPYVVTLSFGVQCVDTPSPKLTIAC